MSIARPLHLLIATALLLMRTAAAQLADPFALNAPAPATVVITAQRPVGQMDYRLSEARIKTLASRYAAMADRHAGRCITRAIGPHLTSRRGNFPIDRGAIDLHMVCAMAAIDSHDTSLRRGIEAFDHDDYPAAFAAFQEAWDKMGTDDAALMLAKMRYDGLGTPKDTALAVAAFRSIADGYFDPWKDTLRIDPGRLQLLNARIEAARILARLYERGEGAPRDPMQAQHWQAKAVEFGYVPTLDLLPEGLEAPAAPPVPMTPVSYQQAAAPAPAAPAEVATLADTPPPTPIAVALAPVAAEPTPQIDPDAFMVVRVTGVRAVPWKSYRAMRAALAAFEDYHSVLAPDAVFRFALLPPPGRTLPPDFALRVRTSEGREFPIALENGELFQLPILPDADLDADLVSNLKGGQLRIGLLVHTRDVPPEQERLGDARMRFVVNQAIAGTESQDAESSCWRSKGMRHCAFNHVSLWHNPRSPANGAVISERGRRTALADNGDPHSLSYKLPLSDARWSNEAIIAFDYTSSSRPLRLAEVAIYNGDD